jgi:hypothetical protein
MSDASMIATSRWGGILRAKPTPWDLRGVNMIAWLGDEDGKGEIYEAAIVSAVKTFAQTIANLITGVYGSVVVGLIAAGGPTKTTSYQWVTVRAAVDNACSLFGMEYRVNKDATIDLGTPTFLGFKVTPTAVAMRRSSGRDLNITGIPTTQLDVSVDVEEYIDRAIVHDATGAYTGATGAATPYLDLYGNTVIIKKIFEEPTTPAAEAASQAAILVAANEVLRKAISLSTDEFDIDRDVVVGDNIYVYDQDGSMVDLTNQVRYRGSFIYPITLRVMAITWPIERGMSVWYRSGAGVWTDLTNYIAWEPPGATFEVGAPVRALTKS